ncbi:FadR/GntR family transcriptional regulator [Kibdelosporangium aridum]|uniref:FadR/GntR family transcriptional regulator n=1 Tax=Kibdelosporangium aridum TaxID=2030 RepID=UPI0006897637
MTGMDATRAEADRAARPRQRPTFKPASTARASDAIISQLRSMISSGELRPGDRLPSERALAEQFQVGRNSVREALRMLEANGVVELKTGSSGGAFLTSGRTDLLARNLADIIQLRTFTVADLTEAALEVESSVIRLACERGGDELFDALDAKLAEADKLTAVGELALKSRLHIEFHQLLADATGNPILVMLMGSLAELRYDLTLSFGPTDDEYIPRTLRELAARIRARDAEGANEVLARYLATMYEHWTSTEYRGSGRP